MAPVPTSLRILQVTTCTNGGEDGKWGGSTLKKSAFMCPVALAVVMVSSKRTNQEGKVIWGL